MNINNNKTFTCCIEPNVANNCSSVLISRPTQYNKNICNDVFSMIEIH